MPPFRAFLAFLAFFEFLGLLAPGVVSTAAAQTTAAQGRAAQGTGAAPSTREEQLAAEEAARARQVTPPGPQPGERIISLFDGPVTTGATASFGGLIPGANFNAGIAYTRFFKDTGSWTARGVYSIRQFWLVEGSSRLPRMWDDRLEITTRAALADGPRVEFFGIGNATPEDAQVFYGHRMVDVGGAATLRPAPTVVLGGGAEFVHREAGHNRGSGPSLEERFQPTSVPGFGDTINFGHYFGSAGIDWRNAAGYASRGGLYQASVHAYRPGGGDDAGSDSRFAFQRVDVDLVQHLPILRDNWIISLRGRLSTTMTDDGKSVPFYLLPRIGGNDGVRGYGAYRYIDRHALLLSAEYRWTPGEAMDMALFWDGGRVAPTRDALTLRGLKSSAGIGVRFHTPSQTALRAEIAIGSEGPRLIIAFSPAF
jgi:hypothetical protein